MLIISHKFAHIFLFVPSSHIPLSQTHFSIPRWSPNNLRSLPSSFHCASVLVACGIDWLHLGTYHTLCSNPFLSYWEHEHKQRIWLFGRQPMLNMMLLFPSCKIYKLSKMIFLLTTPPTILWIWEKKLNESYPILFLQKKKIDSQVQFH